MSIIKFSSDGAFQWIQYYGTRDYSEEATGITLDETNGKLYVCGYGKVENPVNVFKLDIIILRYSTDGTLDTTFKKIVGSSSSTANS